MADGVDIDLYADDLEQGFSIKVSYINIYSRIWFLFCQTFHNAKDEFNDDVDLYDDVIAAPSSEPHERSDSAAPPSQQTDRSDGHDMNGGFAHVGNNLAPNHLGRRHQLYVGNLTWVSAKRRIAFCFRGKYNNLLVFFLFIAKSVDYRSGHHQRLPGHWRHRLPRGEILRESLKRPVQGILSDFAVLGSQYAHVLGAYAQERAAWPASGRHTTYKAGAQPV